MSNIPEFHFDFEAVEGQPFEEATVTLFKQLEDHYNAHIKPAPILFGKAAVARPGQPTTHIPASQVQHTQIAVSEQATINDKDAIPVKDWEIKSGSELGLKKGGAMLNGVRSDTLVEVFDTIHNYTEGATILEGDSGVYKLEAK